MRTSRLAGSTPARAPRSAWLAALLIALVVRLVFHGLAADLEAPVAAPRRVLLRRDARPAELALLPGIGSTQARLLSAELRRGASADDLLAIPGVGEVTLGRLRRHLEPALEAEAPSSDDRTGQHAPAAGSDPQGDRRSARGGPGRAR